MSHDINYNGDYDIVYQHKTTTITDEDMTTVRNHNHDSHEIYFLISGKVHYFIEGKMYPLPYCKY